MKENIQSIQTGLLVVIALTVIYGTFLKENTPPRRERVERQTPQRSAVAAGQTTNLPNTAPVATPPVNVPVVNPTTISFDKMQHNFGEINQDTENKTVFTFTNTGNKPLIIESAKGSCGCTVPEYPKDPIAPGATAEIKVVYKPGKQKGVQNKTVTVVANTEPRDTRLNIMANVQEI